MNVADELLDTDTRNKVLSDATIKDLNFPLTFEFKLSSLANDFNVKDASGNPVVYVRQKMFKFKEAISVFADQTKSNVLYTINADRVIDFNASYGFTNSEQQTFGKVGRKGAKSILKAHYTVFDQENNSEFLIQEENPWAKFFDALMSEVPVVGMFTGYMFNPKYTIKRNDGTLVARLSKEKSFFGRKFRLDKLEQISNEESERMLLSLMMMSLLERRRG